MHQRQLLLQKLVSANHWETMHYLMSSQEHGIDQLQMVWVSGFASYMMANSNDQNSYRFEFGSELRKEGVRELEEELSRERVFYNSTDNVKRHRIQFS